MKPQNDSIDIPYIIGDIRATMKPVKLYSASCTFSSYICIESAIPSCVTSHCIPVEIFFLNAWDM